MIGALNGTTVCLFLEGDNVLEDAEESPVRVGGGGAREYAGGLSPGSELGKDLSDRCQKLHHYLAERRWTYRFAKDIAWGWINHEEDECRTDVFNGSDLTRTMLD